MQLQDGHVYKDRVGDMVTVFLVRPGTEQPFMTVPHNLRYSSDGSYFTDGTVSNFDLVEEVTDGAS